jgi:iron complex transport system permease protein
VRRLLLLIIPPLFSDAVLLGPAGVDPHIIETVRLPRALGAVVGNVLLSVSGLLLQTALRNPLADSYVLGGNGVAVLAALGSYLLWRLWGLPFLGFLLGALLGAAAATAALLLLARRAGMLVVLMAGVLLSYAASSALQLALLDLPQEELGYIYVGLQGSFAAYPAGVWGYVVAAAALVLVLFVYFNSRHVAALLHGEEAAAGLGVDVKKAVVYVVGAASAGVGVAVASVGPVGFVGLLAPPPPHGALGSRTAEGRPGASGDGGARRRPCPRGRPSD